MIQAEWHQVVMALCAATWMAVVSPSPVFIDPDGHFRLGIGTTIFLFSNTLVFYGSLSCAFMHLNSLLIMESANSGTSLGFFQPQLITLSMAILAIFGVPYNCAYFTAASSISQKLLLLVVLLLCFIYRLLLLLPPTDAGNINAEVDLEKYSRKEEEEEDPTGECTHDPSESDPVQKKNSTEEKESEGECPHDHSASEAEASSRYGRTAVKKFRPSYLDVTCVC